MKQLHGHYCKICGLRRANEKFNGSGNVAHICKDCARLPIEKRNKREEVREAAEWAYEIRFPEKNELEASFEDLQDKWRDYRESSYRNKAIKR